jgi:hypothetical protein
VIWKENYTGDLLLMDDDGKYTRAYVYSTPDGKAMANIPRLEYGYQLRYSARMFDTISDAKRYIEQNFDVRDLETQRSVVRPVASETPRQARLW